MTPAPAGVLRYPMVSKRSISRVVFAMGIAVAGLIFATSGRAETRVDLELLLAVDVSGSVDHHEYALQIYGLARAFRDETVLAAIRRAGPRGIAVAVVQWSGGHQQVRAINWTHLNSEGSLRRFSNRLLLMPRYLNDGDTWIADAVRFSMKEIAHNGFYSPRQVIDVSGDGGVESLGLTAWARDDAVVAGMVINGLAIETDVPDLRYFFRDNMIGGHGAFVMRAVGYEEFADTMRRKLIREIGDRPMAGLQER